MLWDYKKIKKQIRDLRNEQQYDKCIELSKEFLNKLNMDSTLMITEKNRYIWFANFMIAKVYKELNLISEAINFANEAMKYCIIKTDIALTKWLLAVCYEEKGMVEKAQKLYEENIQFYAENNMIDYLCCMVSNYAKVVKDDTKAKEVIDFYKKQQSINKEFLDGMYENLFYIYMNKLKYIEAYVITNEVDNPNLRNKLIEQLQTVA